jgi:HEPN domain-containing protein
MNPETINNWLMRAEHDLKIGRDELNTKDPATDMICFHMQQCAEKYPKAYLAFHDKEIKRNHDIDAILYDCIDNDKSFSMLSEKKVGMLTPYGTLIRYPDDFYMPTMAETEEAVVLSLMVKDFVREKLKAAGFSFGKNRE